MLQILQKGVESVCRSVPSMSVSMDILLECLLNKSRLHALDLLDLLTLIHPMSTQDQIRPCLQLSLCSEERYDASHPLCMGYTKFSLYQQESQLIMMIIITLANSYHDFNINTYYMNVLAVLPSFYHGSLGHFLMTTFNLSTNIIDSLKKDTSGQRVVMPASLSM